MNGSSLMQRGMKNEFAYVKHLTKHYSKSFFLATQLLPAERRRATYALYGFCRYADNIIDVPRNRSKKDLTVEIDHLASEVRTAYRTGESEHPVIKPFIATAVQYGIPMEYPLDLLKGVTMDLYIPRYETLDDLKVFCYRVASTVGLMMTHVLGYKSDEAFQYAQDLGMAMQLTNILRDVKEDAGLGRIYIPREEMQRFGVSESDIMFERPTDNLIRLMESMVGEAHRNFERAQPGIHLLRRESQYAIYAASRIYRGILHQIEEAGYNPFPQRAYVSRNRKLAILVSEFLMTRLRPAPALQGSYITRNV